MKQVIAKILTALIIPVTLLGIWYDPFPYWKTLATIALGIWVCTVDWKFKK